MSSFFSPKVNVPESSAKPATIDEAARAQDFIERMRRRRGRAQTVLVRDQAQPAAASTVLGG